MLPYKLHDGKDFHLLAFHPQYLVAIRKIEVYVERRVGVGQDAKQPVALRLFLNVCFEYFNHVSLEQLSGIGWPL